MQKSSNTLCKTVLISPNKVKAHVVQDDKKRDMNLRDNLQYQMLCIQLPEMKILLMIEYYESIRFLSDTVK
jgi:hypothetical protein